MQTTTLMAVMYATGIAVGIAIGKGLVEPRVQEYRERLDRIIGTPHGSLHCDLVAIAKGDD